MDAPIMVGSTSCGAVLRPLARPPSCFPVRRPHTFPSAPIASSSSSGPARWTSAGYATRAARIEADLEAAESVLDADVGSDSVNARTQRRVQSYMERTYEVGRLCSSCSAMSGLTRPFVPNRRKV